MHDETLDGVNPGAAVRLPSFAGLHHVTRTEVHVTHKVARPTVSPITRIRLLFTASRSTGTVTLNCSRRSIAGADLDAQSPRRICRTSVESIQADDDPALEQQRFEVAKAWLKLEIPVHSAAENGCWKAVAVTKQARCRDAG
jgi:hypothetical protein